MRIYLDNIALIAEVISMAELKNPVSGLRSPNDYELRIMDYGFYNTRDEVPFDKLRTGSATRDERRGN